MVLPSLANIVLSWIKWEKSTNFHLQGSLFFFLGLSLSCSFVLLLFRSLSCSFVPDVDRNFNAEIVSFNLYIYFVARRTEVAHHISRSLFGAISCVKLITLFHVTQTTFLSCLANLRLCGLIYIQHDWNIIASAPIMPKHIFKVS